MTVYSNIPVPQSRTRGASGMKYPADKLAVGQVFFESPKDGEDLTKAVKRMNSVAQRARKGDKAKKFAVRITPHPDTAVQCVGVWRVA